MALYQPVAADLRRLMAADHLIVEFERIGDLAVNIAERVRYLTGAGREAPGIDFTAMAEKAQEMLTKSLDAFVNMDPGPRSRSSRWTASSTR